MLSVYMRSFPFHFTFIVMVASTMAGCLSPEEQKALDAAFSNPQQDEGESQNPPALTEQCYFEEFRQPAAIMTKKIDLLFVLDTSGSLIEERKSIGDGIEAFLQALPPDVDAQIAVLLAHVGTWSGKLYTRNSTPAVLKTSDYTNSQLRSILRDRMERAATENESDGGEAGLYSLNQALQTEKLARARTAGFFREEAALAVVFVADENDICARIPQGVSTVKDPEKKEGPAFQKYCNDVTPESVVRELKSLQGDRPLVVSGIVYNQSSLFPNSGENEIAWGYLEAIQSANGIAVDLSGGKIHEGLANIGSLVTKKLSLLTEFKLSGADFSASSLSVLVDGENVDFKYLNDKNEIQLTGNAGSENSQIYISYCKSQEYIDEGELENFPTPTPDPILAVTNFVVKNITSTSANIAFFTTLPTTGKIEVFLSGTQQKISEVTLSRLETQRDVLIENLVDGSSYSVVLTLQADAQRKITAGPIAFTTPFGN